MGTYSWIAGRGSVTLTHASRDHYQRKRQKKGGGCAKIFAVSTLVVLVGLLLGLLYVGYVVQQVWKLTPTSENIANYKPAEGLKILSADGEVLAVFAKEQREPATYDEIPQQLRDAVIAVEDKEFESHKGVYAKGLLRAIVVNLKRGRYAQGASTITMQLARNAFLSSNKSVNRKLKEVILSIKIEQTLTKEQIIEMYLNVVYFGRGAYGVKRAAHVFFGKDLDQLTLSQCAFLAGVIQRPSHFSNPDYRQAALERRDLVLKFMLEQGRIDQASYRDAVTSSLRFARAAEEDTDNQGDWKSPYYVSWIKSRIDELREQNGLAMWQGGVIVRTSLNYQMQRAAEAAMASMPRALRAAGLVCLDPSTGDVLAMVGGRNWDENQYNNVTQGRRQPGSAFKPVVYATAIEAGELDAHSRLPNMPLHLGKWSPKNMNNKYSSSVSISDAITFSINIPAINALRKVGPQAVVETAAKMGIGDGGRYDSKLDPTLALALGASAIKPIELARAYSTIANKGYCPMPRGILSIEDSTGQVMQDFTQIDTKRAISASTADVVDQLLKGPVDRPGGTAHRALRNWVGDARGKTGTTNEGRDAWFAGYWVDPKDEGHKLVTIVWVAKPVTNSKGQTRYATLPGYGGTLCAPVWDRFMRVAAHVSQNASTTHKDSSGNAVQTKRVKICQESGKLATSACPNPIEVTVDVNAKEEYCDIHRPKRKHRTKPEVTEPVLPDSVDTNGEPPPEQEGTPVEGTPPDTGTTATPPSDATQPGVDSF
ncbi:MAG: transglycosylase domain-containing protein [Armatimonadota bacterium]